jgi:hypothetical protein
MIALNFLMIACMSVISAQPASGTPGDAHQAERAARLDVMRQVVQKMKVYTLDDGRREEVPLRAEPVLRMTDMSREREDGTIWLWGPSGRPVAMLQFWRQFDQGNAAWWGAISSLWTTPVEADLGSGYRWRPERGGLAPQAFPDAPAPAQQSAARLRQMKQLATRLTAHEMGDPQRTEFRILPTPVHRYSEPAARILDGAVFVFCHDTDPEIIVLIDAFDGSPQTWRFALAPMSSAELHVLLDGREVWSVPPAPGITGRPSDPYWLVGGLK